MLRRCLLFLPALFLPRRAPAQASKPKPHRLETLRWDAVDDILSISISEGEITDDGKYVAKTVRDYHMDLSEGVMWDRDGRRKPFLRYEGILQRRNIHMLEMYAVESVHWYDSEPYRGEEPPKERPKAE